MMASATPMEDQILVVGAFPHLRIGSAQVAQFSIQPGFHISQDRVSTYDMLDSFVATPSRYLFEMVRRTAASLHQPQRILIFNPLLRLSTFVIRLTLARVAAAGSGDAVIRSSNDLPLAYLLNIDPAEDYRHLLLLSCSKPDLDQNLLAALYFKPIEMLAVNFPCLTTISNGFLPGDYWRPMEWCAQNALVTLHAAESILPRSLADRRALRDAVRMSAFFTHHAGDALFMAIAASTTQTPLFDEILINESYYPITQNIPGKIRFSTVSGPIPFRGEYRKEDCHHFLDMTPKLPKGVFHVYCRGTRNYNFTDFHYIDHFRFCLGEAITDTHQLHRGLADEVPPAAQSRASSPPSILLHFDAGWPLKIYPQSEQIALIALLRKKGFRLVTLDAHEPLPDVDSVRFGTLAEFDKLIDSVDIVVGMDSFPVHYAAQSKGIKTIHLFSSTHPIHSWAGDGNSHRALHKGKSCCPCLGWDKCVRYGGSVCHNFASPADVAQCIDDILSTRAHAQPALDPKTMPSSKCPRQFQQSSRKMIIFHTKDIATVPLRLMRPIWYLALIPIVIFVLLAEFITAIRHEGPRKALYLTWAFLHRHFSRVQPWSGRQKS